MPEPAGGWESMTTMNASMGPFLIRWLVNALAVFVATQVVPGIECESWGGLLAATLLLGLLNAFVRPLLLVLSLPLVVVSLGLFLWVINAALLFFVGWLVKPFVVAGFGSALLGAAVISLVSILLGAALGLNPRPLGEGTGARVRLRRRDRGRRGGNGGAGGGPVIDV